MTTRTQTMMRDLEVIHHAPQADAHPVPLLFVHGAWHGAWCWDTHFLPYFASHGYDAYALSLRAHGNSAGRSPRWASASDYIADVAYIANQLPVPPVIIGHSMGGYITQKYLEVHPASGAILLASIPVGGILPLNMRFIRDFPLDFLRAGLLLSPYQLVRRRDLARHHFFSETLPPETIDAYFDRLQEESMRILLDSTAFALPRPERVRGKVPMLVVAAERDTIFTLPEERDTAEAYRADYRTMDMAHDMMLEPNWHELAEMMQAWLHTHIPR